MKLKLWLLPVLFAVATWLAMPFDPMRPGLLRGENLLGMDGSAIHSTMERHPWAGHGGEADYRAAMLRSVGIDPITFEMLPQTPPANGDSIGVAGVLGPGAAVLTPCVRDTVIVRKISSAANYEAELGTFPADHPDTLKIVMGGTGGWTGTGQVYNGTVDCTIFAHQTFRGGGVGFDHTHTQFVFSSGSHDMVFEGGTVAQIFDSKNTSNPMVNVRDVDRAVFMNMTCLWGMEKTCFQAGPGTSSEAVQNITFFRNLHADCGTEPTSNQYSSGDNGGTVTQLADYQAVFSHCSHRNSNWATGSNSSTDPEARIGWVYNTLGYETRQAHTQIGGWYMNVRHTQTRPGPKTICGNLDPVCASDSRDFSWGVALACRDPWNTTTADSLAQVYVEGIVGVHNSDPATTTNDLWWVDSDANDEDDDGDGEVACYYKLDDADGGGDPRTYPYTFDVQLDTPATALKYPLTAQSQYVDGDQVYTTLIGASAGDEIVGDYRILDCDGTFSLRTDSARTAVTNHIRNQTTSGPMPYDQTSIEASENYTKAAGTECTDADNNFLYDTWETEHFGATGQDIDGDPDGDTWTNIEEMLRGTDPNVATDGTVEPGFESATLSTTFGTGVYVRKYTARDTQPRIFDIDGDGAPDTLGVRIWPDGIALQAAEHCMSGDTVSLLVSLSDPGGGTLMDSTEVADFVASTGDCGTVTELRATDVGDGAMLIPQEKPKPEDPPEPVYATWPWLKVA